MSAKIAVTRTDHTPESLRKLALSHKYRDCRNRLRALALMMEDTLSRGEIARRVGVDVQTLRDWVVRYDEAGVDGLRDAARPGRPPKLDTCQEAQLVAWMDAGPDPEAGEPCCWTVDIRHWIKCRFDMDFTVEGVRRMIRRLDFRHVSPRPIHPRARPEDQENFRQNFRELAMAALPDGVSGEDVLVFFRDEARIGQKGMLSRVWERKGTRPRIPRDHRYGYVYLFSAACPETGGAVGHVRDKANTDSAASVAAYGSWNLPSGHGLAAGEIRVAPGASEELGNVVVSCPAGGAACVVTVAADGTASYDRTGGTPSVTRWGYCQLGPKSSHVL